MRDRDVMRVVERISYKPETTLSCRWTPEHIEVMLSCKTWDSDCPSEKIKVGAVAQIYYHDVRDELEVFQIVRDLIDRFEMHEMDEWLKLDGVALNHSHRRQNGT